MANKRGAFIVIEGLDRSGKSTQSSAIFARLREHNIPSRLIKFPDRTTPIGKIIDAYLKSQSNLDDRAIHLLFSANRWELATSIQQILTSSAADTVPTLILADRYAFSGIAFSHAKGLPYTWCRAPDVSLPAPDLTVFLDISPEYARERGGYGEERYEKEEMQKKVREVFLRMANEMTGDVEDRRVRDRRWITIDASRSIEHVTDDIWNAILPLIHGTAEPLSRLWEDQGDF
ncbi:hypothetical protein APHAL10511_003876 [Amanita phalloides]|nr:hypothetical protein APHAL10511_003876 [Amanita phalloides]